MNTHEIVANERYNRGYSQFHESGDVERVERYILFGGNLERLIARVANRIDEILHDSEIYRDEYHRYTFRVKVTFYQEIIFRCAQQLGLA